MEIIRPFAFAREISDKTVSDVTPAAHGSHARDCGRDKAKKKNFSGAIHFVVKMTDFLTYRS